MRTLDRKLWRELWAMRGQALAIALVIAGGVAVYIMSLTTYDSLHVTRESYYAANRFAEVFGGLKRAPNHIAERLRAIPGVDKVETRVVAAVNLEIDGFSDPVTGQLVSIPDSGTPLLNQLHLRQGRLADPSRDNEVVISETFAEAHRFAPGDSFSAVLNGRQRRLTIVGIALSPEYIYHISPGAILPDYKRSGVLWMAYTPLAAAFDMQGAFNHVTATLNGQAPLEDVIERIDEVLERYGGRGAYGRADQLSHHFLAEELKQLQTLAYVFPVIFLGVAAFLLNVVLTRLLNLQREQVATLKAFGYSNLAVGLHYFKLVLLIVLFGTAGGVAIGLWMGHALSLVYMEYYRFPFLLFELRPWVGISAVLVSLSTAVIGTVYAIRHAAAQPPAQAMRPEPPAAYRATLIERLGLQRFLAQPTRMIVRHIERRPLKALLSILGIAFACGIMMVGNFQRDAVSFMVDAQFRLSQREDLSLTFIEPTARQSLSTLRALPGVQLAEGFRSVPVRLHFEHRHYRTLLRGVAPDDMLLQLLDTELQPLQLPPEGIVLTDHLGKRLGVGPGDRITVEVLEGARPVRQVPVAGLTRQYLGVWAYMDRTALNRLLGEGDVISGANLAVDNDWLATTFDHLRAMPRVVGTVVRETAVRTFNDIMEDTILFFSFTATLLGGVIAFGVVYNSARIALSERARELASLRVLGFTRGEIAYILLGELALFTLVAIPLGFLVGYGLCLYLALNLQSDLYRVPLVLHADTYATAASVVLASSAISAMLIWRKLAHLDLIAVLKTKE